LSLQSLGGHGIRSGHGWVFGGKLDVSDYVVSQSVNLAFIEWLTRHST